MRNKSRLSSRTACLFSLALAVLVILSCFLTLQSGVYLSHTFNVSNDNQNQQQNTQNQGMSSLPSALLVADMPGTFSFLWPKRVQSSDGETWDFPPEPSSRLLAPVLSSRWEENATSSFSLGCSIMSVPFLGGNPPPCAVNHF